MTTQKKHTPDHGLTGIEPATAGPWNVYNCTDGSINVCGNKDYPDGICKILWSGSRARDIANTRLIAAAPELLEALKQYIFATTEDAPTPMPEDSLALIWARAAIAKAEGRA